MKEKRFYRSLSNLLNCLLLVGAAGVLLQVSACSFYQPLHVEDFEYLDNDLTAEGTIANEDISQYMDMDELEGFAAMPGEGLHTTTGGMYGEVVIVENTVELANAVKGDIPRIVVVKGQIVSMLSNDDMDLNQADNLSDNMAVKGRGGYGLSVGSNKTIVGYDENAELYGGLLDIKTGADYITVSWCKFWYEDVVCEWDTKDGTQNNRVYKAGATARASDHGHRFSCLIGSGAGDHDDTDMGKLHVTYHHNWFADFVKERMPRVMYGQVHIYNNYYTCSGNNYCIGVDSCASVLIENNYFKNVKNPHEFSYPENTALGACITARGNEYEETAGTQDAGQKNDKEIAPFENAKYDYYCHAASDVPDVVTQYAGSQSRNVSVPK